MARSVPALVEPAVLKWARNSRGLTVEEAAQKFKQEPQTIEAWECGEKAPTVAQLRCAAKFYARPLAVFYLPEPPTDFDALKDFRQVPGRSMTAGPALLAAVRRAHELRSIWIDLTRELGDDFPKFDMSASMDGPIQTLAKELREKLEIDLTTQLRWKDDHSALRNWRQVLERSGILVFQFPEPPLGHNSVDPSEARGFSIPLFPAPVVAVNAKDPPNARIFTLFHEVAHLLLRRSGLCDLQDPSDLPPEERKIEVFCNAFSGEFLVPSDDLRARVSSTSKNHVWEESELKELAIAYSVSREVIVRRLLSLNLATQAFYQQKRAQYSRESANRKQLSKSKTEGFRIPYFKLVLRSVGSNYASSVLRAMNQGRISESSAAGFLRVKVKHLDRLENAVFNRQATRKG